MMIPSSELKLNDYRILGYINKFGSVSKEQIFNTFPNIDAIDRRLSQLSEPLLSPSNVPVKNSSYIVEEYETYKKGSVTRHKNIGVYHISDYGKQVLQDYKVKLKSDRREFWRRSILTPILVAVLTTLITNGILQLLSKLL